MFVSDAAKIALAKASSIVLGYIPLAMAFGIIAKQAGLSMMACVAMSTFVFAGSAQYIAIGMIMAGQGSWAIIGTTFFVNLRHILLSSAIAPFLKSWKSWQRIALGAELTDESFVILSQQFEQEDTPPTTALTINMIAHASWILGSILGYALSQSITDFSAWGLDYALPAMFIALLMMQMRHVHEVVVAVLSGSIAIICIKLGWKTSAAMIATIVTASLGTLWKIRAVRSYS